MEFLSGSCAALEPDASMCFPAWKSAVLPCLLSLITVCDSWGEYL